MGYDLGKERKKVPIWLITSVILIGIQLLILHRSVRAIGRYESSDYARLTDPQIRVNAVGAAKPVTPQRTDKPDGTFNNFPIYFNDGKNDPIHSSVQCVGENYNKLAWIHRSCKFRHLCFDMTAQEFVIYQSKEEQELQEAMHHREFHDTSNTMNVTVAIGGINTKWTWKRGVPRMEWFPKIIQGELTEPYYELDPSVVWIPIHSLAGFNPGHLVWDDFLPVYTLLRMFQLFEGKQLLMMRYILKGERMWATCDLNDVNANLCKKMYEKFLPLIAVDANQFSTSEGFTLEVSDKKSNLICATQGAAGVGMLTDHGIKLHGWESNDYATMHNHGRGSLLFDFRNYMVSNVGIALGPISAKGPYKITFSLGSSHSSYRNFNFNKQMEAIKNAFGDKVDVKAVMIKDYTVKEQVQIAVDSAIFITACGGGAVTATFLSQGASVILYYPETGGVRNNRMTGLPALLDWDLFNNAAYLRTHWLPTTTMDDVDDLLILVKLIRHDLDLIASQEF